MLILDILYWVGIGILILLAMVVGGAVSYLLFALAEHYLYRLQRYRALRAFAKVNALMQRLDVSIPRKIRNDRLHRAVGQPANRVAHAIFMLEKRRDSLQRDNDLRRGAFTRREWKYLRQDAIKVLQRAAFLESFVKGKGPNDGIWPFKDRPPSFIPPNNYARNRKDWERPETPSFDWDQDSAEESVVCSAPRTPTPALITRSIAPSAELPKTAAVVVLADVPRKTKSQPQSLGVYNARGQVVPFERPANKIDLRA